MHRSANRHDTSPETLSGYSHQFNPSRRHRLKLLTVSCFSHLKHSLRQTVKSGQHAIESLGVRVALQAGHQLLAMAEKIDKKAHATNKK